jgi:hypothetical protein
VRRLNNFDYYELLKEAYLHTRESGQLKRLLVPANRAIIRKWFVPHFMLLVEFIMEEGDQLW